MLKSAQRLTLAALLAAASSCGQAPTPEAADLAAAATADAGAFEAFDEACTGVGDLSESLPKAKQKGWIEFTPTDESTLDDYRKMLLDGSPLDRPEVVLLRKNSNRAEIVMWETRTLSGSDYVCNCDVLERSAPGLDLNGLKNWAKVSIEARQIDDSPEYQDLLGGRFANGAGGKATAYFASERGPNEPLQGLVITIARSSFAPKGKR